MKSIAKFLIRMVYSALTGMVIFPVIVLFFLLGCNNTKPPVNSADEGRLSETSYYRTFYIDSCEFYSIGNATGGEIVHKPKCKYCLRQSQLQMNNMMNEIVSKDSANISSLNSRISKLSIELQNGHDCVINRLKWQRLEDSANCAHVMTEIMHLELLNYLDTDTIKYTK